MQKDNVEFGAVVLLLSLALSLTFTPGAIDMQSTAHGHQHQYPQHICANAVGQSVWRCTRPYAIHIDYGIYNTYLI